MSDIIEGLTAELDQQAAEAASWCIKAQEAQAEVARLKAEREKHREALRLYADSVNGGQIARARLGDTHGE